MAGSKRKYEEAHHALESIVSEGLDKSRDGRLLKPSIVKKLDIKFENVPTSTFRRMVMQVRESKNALSPASAILQSKFNSITLRI